MLPSEPNVNVPIDNRCATLDGPPSVRCPTPKPFVNDLWFTYVAPCTGTVTVSLCLDTDFDAIMAVYGGEATCDCPGDNSSLVRCGDDTCGPTGGPPSVRVDVTEQACYLVRVAGWSGATGWAA